MIEISTDEKGDAVGQGSSPGRLANILLAATPGRLATSQVVGDLYCRTAPMIVGEPGKWLRSGMKAAFPIILLPRTISINAS